MKKLIATIAIGLVSAVPPNILLMIADDMSEVPLDSSKYINLNSLMSDSTTYVHAYTQFPVCGPSRASFLTGRYPDETKNYNFVEKVVEYLTMPKYLKSKGYTTASFGKVFHLPYAKTVSGSWYDFYKDHWSVKDSVGSAMSYDFNADGQCRNGAIYCDISQNDATDQITTSRVLNFINSHESPWFIAVGFRRPHLDLAVPRSFVNRVPLPDLPNITMITPRINLNYYECDDVYNGKMLFGAPGKQHLEPLLNGNRRISSDIAKKNPLDVRIFMQWYMGAILFIDYQVGRITSLLKNKGIYSDTIIVFIGDNGWKSGHHGEWCKNNLDERSTNVPLIIKGPLQKISILEKRPVELIDVFPTVLSMAKLPIPSILSGKDLSKNVSSFYAFSQYPRCSSINDVQSTKCMMSGVPICNTLPSIKFMGYSVRGQYDSGSDYYTYIVWKPFKYVEKSCSSLFPGASGTVPFIDKVNSYTKWNDDSLRNLSLLFKNPSLNDNRGTLVKNPAIEAFFYKLIYNKFSVMT